MKVFHIVICSQHSAAHPHYSPEVRQWLSENYPGRWREVPFPWPPRLPDFNPLEFYQWRCRETKAYATRINGRDELLRRIQQFSSETKNALRIFERLRDCFLRRTDSSIREHGDNFEHILYEKKSLFIVFCLFVSLY
jgi:hypothetical protein